MANKITKIKFWDDFKFKKIVSVVEPALLLLLWSLPQSAGISQLYFTCNTVVTDTRNVKQQAII